MRTITKMQMAFCRERFKGTDCVESALLAGHTETQAKKKAYAWIGKTRETSVYPLMFDYLEMLHEQAFRSMGVDRDWVYHKYVNIAKGDPYDYFNEEIIEIESEDEDGLPIVERKVIRTAKSRDELTESQRTCIKKLTFGKTTIELHDQTKAIDVLREEMGGLNIEHQEQVNPDPFSNKDIDDLDDIDDLESIHNEESKW